MYHTHSSLVSRLISSFRVALYPGSLLYEKEPGYKATLIQGHLVVIMNWIQTMPVLIITSDTQWLGTKPLIFTNTISENWSIKAVSWFTNGMDSLALLIDWTTMDTSINPIAERWFIADGKTADRSTHCHNLECTDTLAVHFIVLENSK